MIFRLRKNLQVKKLSNSRATYGLRLPRGIPRFSCQDLPRRLNFFQAATHYVRSAGLPERGNAVPAMSGFAQLLEVQIPNVVPGLLAGVQGASKTLFWKALIIEQKIEHGHSQNSLVVVNRLHHIAYEHDLAETVGYFAKRGLFLMGLFFIW